GSTALPTEITGLPPRLADLEGRLAALEQRPAGSPGDAAAIDALKTQLADFDTRLKAAEASAADIASLKQGVAGLTAGGGKSANSAAGVVLSISTLQRQIVAGKPYAAALVALESFAGGDPALGTAVSPSLAALKANADKGVSTVADLQGAFPETA